MDSKVIIAKVVAKLLNKKTLSKAQQYIKQGDLCQDSEEAKECYENALRCSDITPKERIECNKNIQDIKSRR